MKAAVIGLALVAVLTTRGIAAEVAPYEAMRSLQALQDRIAAGDSVAGAAHAKAIVQTTKVFIAAKPAIWQDKRNARALVVYLFSGGDAARIGDAIAPSLVAPEVRTLYEGALAYGAGNDGLARDRLLSIDAKAQPASLGGHLALIQATLVANGDAAKAIAFLDVARLLEPGTLVEEAALRKEMSLIGSQGDLDKFALLARRYLGAYSRSIYVDNFRQLVAKAADQLGSGNSPQAVEKLARLMAALDRAERRRLYLAIAREALLSGRTTMAALAGSEARRLAMAGDRDHARATLYFGAATIIGSGYDEGVAALAGVAPDRLDQRDRALRTSALAVADLIRRPPGTDKDAEAKGQLRAVLTADAERAIAATDDLVKDAPK